MGLELISRGILGDELELVYTIIYSYWYFYEKIFLPQVLHVYTYSLIRSEVIRDMWRDWLWTGMGPYSNRLGFQILLLRREGLIRETCLENICGLLTISNSSFKPEKLFFTKPLLYTM